MQRILIIDEDYDYRTRLHVILTDAGYLIREAGTFQQGLALAQAELPQLVLLALNTPDSYGFSPVKELRSIPGFAAPILLLTLTKVENGCKDSPSRTLFTGYLNKAGERDEILDCVDFYLQRAA